MGAGVPHVGDARGFGRPDHARAVSPDVGVGSYALAFSGHDAAAHQDLIASGRGGDHRC